VFNLDSGDPPKSSIIGRVKTLTRVTLIVLLGVVLVAPSSALQPMQSPIPTAAFSPLPTPPATVPIDPNAGASPISPVVWIAVGALLGLLIVFVAQRTASHDR
jgi:hypothetical protein